MEPTRQDLENELALDVAQLTLDLIGVVEPTPFADTASGLISLYRGDWLGAGISVASWIPYLGDLAKAGKLPKLVTTVLRAVELAARDAAFSRAVGDRLLKLHALVAKIPLPSIPAPIRAQIETLAKALDDFTKRVAKVAEKAPARIGPYRLLDDLEVDSFLKALGKQSASALVRQRVAKAGGFLMHHFKDAGSALNYMRGIDLSKEVNIVQLSPGQIITQHYDASGLGAAAVQKLEHLKGEMSPQALGLRLGSWFSRTGVASQNLGISQGVRRVIKLRVTKAVYILESTASHTVDFWTWGRTADRYVPIGSASDRVMKAGEFASGGGVQLVLPKAQDAVVVVGRP
ncbi:hypothetical protein [Sorangium sp. So ce1024]|uniref:hypothetical protein n=1 Tax=Sorangium sp. So ce1024 TaxID=3133327 RepID=UPI003F10C6B1